ncbi:hypothetical protein DOS86_04695 [Anaplasma marginale]|uniref:hypothetical protein n=1 Tax=Anaplasma marginale TaxID=770 RepID=UPI000DF0048E|nr:hypothetical protein [Anaplasma marginale]RCL19439.1 hypothetical protein DOS86_04695 [Anaplasma marginale]
MFGVWKKSGFCCIVACALLSSCITTEEHSRRAAVYEPPASVEGRACVARCAHTRNDCYRKCQDKSQECEARESRNSASRYIGGIMDMLDGFIKRQEERDRISSCEARKSACISNCSSDTFCAFRCESQYRCTGGSFKIGIGKPTFRDKRDSCSTRRCDALCKNDYDVCYVDECGGRIYEAQQEPKPRPDSSSQTSG